MPFTTYPDNNLGATKNFLMIRLTLTLAVKVSSILLVAQITNLRSIPVMVASSLKSRTRKIGYGATKSDPSSKKQVNNPHISITNHESIIGSVQVQDHLHIAVTTNDGDISMYKVQQLTVHALQGDKYAYRDNLTDIVVQSMSSNSKIRLKCKELVKNVSIYKDKLTAHLTERILIYGLAPEDSQMKYKLHKRLLKKVDAHILEVVQNHFLACIKNKIQLYQLNGDLEKEWIFDSRVNCLKIIGGMPSKEGALVGLKNG